MGISSLGRPRASRSLSRLPNADPHPAAGVATLREAGVRLAQEPIRHDRPDLCLRAQAISEFVRKAKAVWRLSIGAEP